MLPVMPALLKIRQTDCYFLVQEATQLEVSGIIELVAGLNGGSAISSKRAHNMNEFYMKCLKRFENFSPLAVTVDGKSIGGSQAVQYHMKCLEDKMSNDSMVSQDLKMLRLFDWCLQGEQRDLRDSWQDECITRRVRPAGMKVLKDDTATAMSSSSKSLVKIATNTGSSSSQPLALMPNLTSVLEKATGAATKAGRKKDTAKVAEKDSLMKFFSASKAK